MRSLDRYDRPRDVNAKGWMFDYDASLKRTFEPRKHELSGEVRFNRAHDQDLHVALAADRRRDERRPAPKASRTDNDAITKQFTGAARLHEDARAAHQARDGLQGQRALARSRLSASRRTHSAPATGRRVELSNALSFDETVHAAYGVLSQGVGKFDLQAGLRAEYASRDFSLAAPATELSVQLRQPVPERRRRRTTSTTRRSSRRAIRAAFVARARRS